MIRTYICWLLVAIAAAIFPASGGELVYVDMAALAAAQTGYTNYWYVVSIGTYSDGTAQFNAKGDYILSPVFSRPITRIELRVKCSANASRFLEFRPVGCAAPIRYAVQCASSENTEVQVIEWSEADNVRQVRIGFSDDSTGSSVWGIAEMTITLSGLAAPTGLYSSSDYRNAFYAEWLSVDGATGYQVCVYHEEIVPESFVSLAEYDFSVFTNDTGSTVNLDAAVAMKYPALFPTNTQLSARSKGFVQIGGNKDLGSMKFPVPVGTIGILFTAAKPESDNYGKDMPVRYHDDAGDKTLDVVSLSTNMMSFLVQLPEATGEAVVFLHSTTNHASASEKRGSVNLKEVRFVSEYAPLMTNRTEVASLETRKTNALVRLEFPGTYSWTVTATGSDEERSASSDFEWIELNSEFPKYMNGLEIRLR